MPYTLRFRDEKADREEVTAKILAHLRSNYPSQQHYVKCFESGDGETGGWDVLVFKTKPLEGLGKFFPKRVAQVEINHVSGAYIRFHHPHYLPRSTLDSMFDLRSKSDLEKI